MLCGHKMWPHTHRPRRQWELAPLRPLLRQADPTPPVLAACTPPGRSRFERGLDTLAAPQPGLWSSPQVRGALIGKTPQAPLDLAQAAAHTERYPAVGSGKYRGSRRGGPPGRGGKPAGRHSGRSPEFFPASSLRGAGASPGNVDSGPGRPGRD